MKQHIRFIFLASFFFSLHMALLAYLNSSMLGQFASPAIISITYTAASVLSLVLVSIAPNIVRTVGALKYLGFALLGSATLLYLISNHSGVAIIPFFVLYFSLNSVILYGLDLFLEHYSAENQTGNIRGLYLTFSNIGWVLAPLVSTTLRISLGYSALYAVASGAVLIAFFILFGSQRGFVDKAYAKSRITDGIQVLRTNKNIRLITSINFLLQLFFVVMVIYSPVYLVTVIGFSWEALGILLTAMLLPFVLFPYPAGRLADHTLGEKELLCAALLLTGITTLYFAHLGYAPLALYAVTLFFTRVGASIVEAMCDSSFFKQVTDADSSVISIYRNMMPVAYTVGPLLAAALFALSSYYVLFSTLGVVITLATLLAVQIKDSR